MSELTKKLHILRAGATEEELATLYSTVDECEEPNLKLEVDGDIAYAKLGDMSDDNATNLRVYNEAENQVYAVLSDAVRNYYVDTDGYTHFVDRAVVETIAKDQYENNEAIATVNFPSTISVEGGALNGAFQNCINLTSADLPNVTRLGHHSFDGCTNLISINLPKVETTGYFALANTGLTEVTLDSLIELGSSAFESCKSLKRVYLPNVTTIESDAFAFCSSLTNFDYGEKLRTMGDAMFNGCSSLVSVCFPGVTNLGDTAKYEGYTFCNCTALEEARLPSVNVDIYGTFTGCTALSSVDLPLVTGIGHYTFRNCTALEEITLPSATYINGTDSTDGAFLNCSSLAEIYIPKVTYIGAFAFKGCTSLVRIHCGLANESAIKALSGYSTKFMADARTQILFDL